MHTVIQPCESVSMILFKSTRGGTKMMALMKKNIATITLNVC